VKAFVAFFLFCRTPLQHISGKNGKNLLSPSVATAELQELLPSWNEFNAYIDKCLKPLANPENPIR
jgi:hypothetical protein